MATRTLEPISRPSTRLTTSPLRRRTPVTFTCANCELEIGGRPTIHVGLAFCCAGCVAGGPCTCSYDEFVQPAAPTGGQLLDEWQVRDCLDITALDEEAEPAGHGR